MRIVWREEVVVCEFKVMWDWLRVMLVMDVWLWCWRRGGVDETHDIESSWDFEAGVVLVDGLFEPSIIEFREVLVVFVFNFVHELPFLLQEFESAESRLDFRCCAVRSSLCEDAREVHEFPDETSTEPALKLNDSMRVSHVDRFACSNPMQGLQGERFYFMHGFLDFILEEVPSEEDAIRC